MAKIERTERGFKVKLVISNSKRILSRIYLN